MAPEDLDRPELEALLATRRELGPAYDRELVDSFAERIERTVDGRVGQELSARQAGDRFDGAAGKRQTALGIVSVVGGIPISAISLAIELGGLGALLVSWAGLVGINGAHAVQSRRRARV
jgi:hypothetical protein